MFWIAGIKEDGREIYYITPQTDSTLLNVQG